MQSIERKITTLGRSNATKMRNSLGFSNINKAIEHYYGLVLPKAKKYSDDVKKQVLELMKEDYNHAIGIINKEVIQANKEIKNNIKTKKQTDRKNAKAFLKNFNIEEIIQPIRDTSKPHLLMAKLDRYLEWWNRKNNQDNSPFAITIESGIAEVSHTFKFKNIYHFYNWFGKVIVEGEVLEIDSFGNAVTAELTEGLFAGLITILSTKVVKGGCNKKVAYTKNMKSSFYTFKLHTPTSKDNNCFFACLKYITGDAEMSAHNMRKQFQLQSGTEISIAQAYEIIHKLDLKIEIRDYDTNEELDDDTKYIIYKECHFYVLESFEEIVKKDKKTKRGLMTFDFETRPTEKFHTIKASGQKMFLLKDSLCKAYFRKYKQTDCESASFITNEEKSSARQFIDFLNSESKQGRTYNVIAHNGGRFDFYFFLANLTPKELLDSEPHFRGTTIISLNYRGNLFKDSCCFLTDSLKNLSKSFKITDGKIVKMNLHGKEITSEQLCFYRDELTFNGFLELQHSDREFWELYEKYCLYDCIALFQIWEKFNTCVNSLVEQISPYLLRSCPLMSSMTIGSHSKKILVEINKCKGKVNYYKQNLETFTGIYYDADKKRQVDYKKYEFLCKFKRGGISHCHQPGKHETGTTGVDIASQYPASLIYAKIPTGKSEWVYTYDKTKHGFYLLKNLVFDSFELKPVALSIKGLSLNWATNDIDQLYADSYMLEYLISNYGLKSFDVVEGLVSNTEVLADKIFGKYVNSFYEEKKLQDKYKSSKDDRYNEALRTTIKLYLNSLTGKLVENPAVHFSLKFDSEETNRVLNGQGVTRNYNDDKINDWIVAGIMVYSYSKRLLFEYIKCLPNNSDDVIHIETDGIYFSTEKLPTFTKNLKNYKGDYPCKFGEDLGNLKIEKSTAKGQVAYFLGKKFYNITLNDNYLTEPRDEGDDNIYRVKGIPQKTIAKDGSPIYLVDTKLYEEVYSGKSVMKSFQTLKKNLFANETSISTFTMTRTVRGCGNYKLYE